MQADHIVLAKVGPEKENPSAFTDFNINFADRQNLKILEDSVIDLQVIVSTALTNIVRVREHCEKCYIKLEFSNEENDSFQQIMNELDEYCKEAETHVERAKLLRERASSTAQLVIIAFPSFFSMLLICL